MLGCIAAGSGVVNSSDGGTIDGTSDALVNISMCSRADDYVHLRYSSARAFDCLMPPPETLSGVSGLVSQQGSDRLLSQATFLMRERQDRRGLHADPSVWACFN